MRNQTTLASAHTLPRNHIRTGKECVSFGTQNYICDWFHRDNLLCATFYRVNRATGGKEVVVDKAVIRELLRVMEIAQDRISFYNHQSLISKTC